VAQTSLPYELQKRTEFPGRPRVVQRQRFDQGYAYLVVFASLLEIPAPAESACVRHRAVRSEASRGSGSLFLVCSTWLEG